MRLLAGGHRSFSVRLKTDMFSQVRIVKCLIATFLILSVVVNNLWLGNSFIGTLLSLPALVLIPLFIGDLTAKLICRSKRGQSLITSLDSPKLAFILWIMGLFIIFLFFSVFYLLSFLSSIFLSYAMLSLSIYGISGSLLLERTRIRLTVEAFRSNIHLVPFIVLSMILPLSMLISKQPFPLGLSETYDNVRAIVQLNSNNLIEITRGHIPLLAPVLSIDSLIYHVHPLFLYNTAPYLNNILYPLFVFFLCYGMSRNFYCSTLASFIAGWAYLGVQTFTFDARTLVMFSLPLVLYMASSSQGSDLGLGSLVGTITFPFLTFFIPFLTSPSINILPAYFRIVAAFMPIPCILLTLNRVKIWKLAPLAVSIPLCIFTAVHDWEGIFTTVLFLVFSIGLTVRDNSSRRWSMMVRTIIIAQVAYVLFLVNYMLPAVFYNNWTGLLGNLFLGTGDDILPLPRYSLLLNYGPAILVQLFILSLIVFAVIGKRHVLSIALVGSTTLFFSVLPEGLFIRAFDFIGPLMSVTVALFLLDVPMSLYLRSSIRNQSDRNLQKAYSGRDSI